MSRRQFRVPPRPDGQPPDDTGCTILHVDMDAFYASASLLARPELVGTPVIIGGGERGVVLSATYEARRFGVASAMPVSRARRLCPQATVVAPDHQLYARISREVMALFADITPIVEPLSADEAFLDVAGAVRLMGSPSAIASQVRARVQAEQGITCSVGVAGTKFVAKIASSLAKPDGMLVVPVAEQVELIQSLPVGALWGVGERTEEVLARHGLHTVADIAHTPRQELVRRLGPGQGNHLHDLSWARDPRRVQVGRRERSIGHERTYSVDVGDPQTIHRTLLDLSERVAARLRAHGQLGATVSIKVRYSDFTTITRSRTLGEPSDVGRELHAAARDLFDALGPLRSKVRLIGVRAEQLKDAATTPVQGRLDDTEQGWRETDRVVDQATARFGVGSIRPATLLGGQGPTRRRAGSTAEDSRRPDLPRPVEET